MRARSLLVLTTLITTAAIAVLGLHAPRDARGEDAVAALDPKDAALIAHVLDALPAGDHKVADVMKALAPSSSVDERDLGYGVRSSKFYLAAVSLTVWVHLLVREDRVAGAAVSFTTGAQGVAAFRTAATARGRDPSEFTARDDDGVTWVDVPRMKALRDAVRAGVGVPDRADRAPKESLDALRRLDDPLRSQAVGTACGEDGEVPRARVALEQLVKTNSLTLLESAIGSPSPEARVYAAEGLLRLQKAGTPLSKETLAGIERVRVATTPIVRCEGCCYDRATAKELLEPFVAK